MQAIDEVGDRIRAEKGLGPDDPFAVRNALSHHEAFLDLIDHPRMLPLVVDAIGWNIQVRTTHLDYRPPYPEDLKASIAGVGKGEDHEAGYRNVGWHPDLASDDLFMAPSLDGRLPFMEIKVFYVLYDMTESNCGNLWLVPGSHRRRPAELQEQGNGVDPEGAVELKLPIGSAVLWRTAVWHCVGPNLSRKTRKIMHVGYHYRWLRPTEFVEQDPDLIDTKFARPAAVAGRFSSRRRSNGAGTGLSSFVPLLAHGRSGRCPAACVGFGEGIGLMSKLYRKSQSLQSGISNISVMSEATESIIVSKDCAGAQDRPFQKGYLGKATS